MIDQVDQRPASCDVTGELNAVEKPPAILRRRQEIIVDDGGVTRLTATEPNVSDGDGGHHSRRQRERSAGRTLRVTAIGRRNLQIELTAGGFGRFRPDRGAARRVHTTRLWLQRVGVVVEWVIEQPLTDRQVGDKRDSELIETARGADARAHQDRRAAVHTCAEDDSVRLDQLAIDKMNAGNFPAGEL